MSRISPVYILDALYVFVCVCVCEGGRYGVVQGIWQSKVAKNDKFKVSETSLICLDIAIGSTYVSHVLLGIPSNFRVPVLLYNQYVLLRYLVYGFL